MKEITKYTTQNDAVDGYVGPENKQFDLVYVIDSLTLS